MNIQHKIVGFNKDILQVLVNFYCDEIPEGLTFAVDLDADMVGDAAAIEAHLEWHKPVGQLTRLASIKAITSTLDTSVVEAMVVTPPVVMRAGVAASPVATPSIADLVVIQP